MQLNDDAVKKLIKHLKGYDSIFLEEPYVKELIILGIKKAGSMHQLGKILGYTCNAPNWPIKQIRDGKQGIPYFRLLRLAHFLQEDPADILRHAVRLKRTGRRIILLKS